MLASLAVFGSLGGSRTGIGYKVMRDEGYLCGGPCARGATDHDNYWFFDLNDIIGAVTPSALRPHAYGAWSVSFDNGGTHGIIGGAYAPDAGILYLSLSEAGQLGAFDRLPVIVAYDVGRQAGTGSLPATSRQLWASALCRPTRSVVGRRQRQGD